MHPLHPILKNQIGIISFSGGKDSMVLLFFYLYLFKNKMIPEPTVFYLNHNIRNNLSEVQNILLFLKNTNLPYYYYSKNIPKISKKLRKSLEETGRLVRYKYLNKIQKFLPSPNYITTGHHCFDYLESVWIHWIRGGGKQALQTLKPWDGNILRPLLYCKDKELKTMYEFIKEFVFEDESNQDETYLRNRIRKSFIPFLEKENFSFYKFYWNFHIHPEFIPSITQTIKPKYYFRIPIDNLSNIKNSYDWKLFLDLHLRLLNLHPAKKSSIQITYESIVHSKILNYHTKEYYLYFHPKNGLFLTRWDSEIFKEPILQYIEQPYRHLKITWNQKSYDYQLANENFLDYSVSPPSPGEKLYQNGIHKEISELLRINGIPPILRKNFPILRKNHIPVKILFELF